MDIFDAVRTVLAVRSYDDRPIPDDVVHRIVEAGRLTASSINLQPWHFVVVQDRETLQQLAKAVTSGPYIDQAPLAVAIAVERDSVFGVSDGSRAVQSMVLTAWDAGVGSNWAGWVGMNAVRELLGIPESYDVIAVLPFGYPASPVGKGKKNRKALGEVASKDRFGVPFE
jgi:nitroreductase